MTNRTLNDAPLFRCARAQSCLDDYINDKKKLGHFKKWLSIQYHIIKQRKLKSYKIPWLAAEHHISALCDMGSNKKPVDVNVVRRNFK